MVVQCGARTLRKVRMFHSIRLPDGRPGDHVPSTQANISSEGLHAKASTSGEAVSTRTWRVINTVIDIVKKTWAMCSMPFQARLPYSHC